MLETPWGTTQPLSDMNDFRLTHYDLSTMTLHLICLNPFATRIARRLVELLREAGGFILITQP